MATAPPLNLAVFRVVVFSSLLVQLTRLPPGATSGSYLTLVSLAATVLAVAGLFTRTTSAVGSLTAIYLLGPAQLVGGGDGTLQPVVLVALLLASARSGDAVSIDSLWQAFRAADRGQIRPAGRHVRYGLPIRLAMVVLALSYFFPAVWQIVDGSGWKIATGFVVAMALAAPIALLWRPTRNVWSSVGFVLHFVATHAAYALQALYVMFVDWQRLLLWAGRKLFASRIVVLYDGNCQMCRRTMAVLLAVDWLRALKPINAFDRERFTSIGLGRLDDAALMKDMHAAERSATGVWRIAKGYDAYQRIAWRVPLLWITLPVIYLPPIAALGRRVYRHVADTRACAVPVAKGASPTRLHGHSIVPVGAVGVLVIIGQVIAGVGGLPNAWPVSCRPLFECFEPSTASSPRVDQPRKTSMGDSPHTSAAVYIAGRG